MTNSHHGYTLTKVHSQSIGTHSISHRQLGHLGLSRGFQLFQSTPIAGTTPEVHTQVSVRVLLTHRSEFKVGPRGLLFYVFEVLLVSWVSQLYWGVHCPHGF